MYIFEKYNFKIMQPCINTVTATGDALGERPESIHETASLLYNNMIEAMEYGQQRLKDIVKKRSRGRRRSQRATARRNSTNNRMIMSNMIRSQK